MHRVMSTEHVISCQAGGGCIPFYVYILNVCVFNNKNKKENCFDAEYCFKETFIILFFPETQLVNLIRYH